MLARFVAALAAMVVVVTASNILVLYPVDAQLGPFNLKDLLTWGAFTYPFAFLVTDLTNRHDGPARARAGRGGGLGFRRAGATGYPVGVASPPRRASRSLRPRRSSSGSCSTSRCSRACGQPGTGSCRRSPARCSARCSIRRSSFRSPSPRSWASSTPCSAWTDGSLGFPAPWLGIGARGAAVDLAGHRRFPREVPRRAAAARALPAR